MELIIFVIASAVIFLLLFWNRRLAGQLRASTDKQKNDIVECKPRGCDFIKSEEHYRNLVDNSMIGVFSSRFDGQLTFVNKALSRMFEFDTPELMMANGSLNCWKDLKQREKFLNKIKKYGKISNYQAEAVTSAGQHIHLLFSASLHADEISGMVIDITDQKILEQKNQVYQLRLKTLASQLTIAEEKERHRIAIDLHDHIGQSLVFLRLQLANLRKKVAEENAQQLIDELSQSTLNLIRDTKDLVFNLSSPLLHEIGLSSAISQFLVDQIGKKNGIETEFRDHCSAKLQNKELSTILFRNVRELLFNTVKHAQATKIIVTSESNEKLVRIIIEDDGTGFNTDRTLKLEMSEPKFGLFSIQERMDDVGGSLKIESEPGKGCKAVLTVPLSI